ncbi:LysR family transcriptional regulator [Oryzicola mucosus]|uniref:LysR family transcriptional regulator n=1 Tax=Oryzicola mucosus TaxID=2767425 RepID=A0A8J6PMK9_9HYPH|nr:LysR family transcriptional regulator [Oryzicola mucosus]MBD0417048.1 LysR family transcriptional regulator [Oryzicola mucosus]
MLDADDMRAFQKVAALLSFSEAGRVLSVRKSAISRSIQRLESLLGVRLFERTTREVVLTEAGRMLLNRFDEVLNRIDELVDVAATLALHPRGRLKLTAGIGFGMEVLTELLPEFSLAFPDIDISLDLTSRTVDLVTEQIDVAVRMGPMRDSSLVATRLGAIGCQLCAAPAYLERRGAPQSLEDLRTHDLLAIPKGDGLPRPLLLLDKAGVEHQLETSGRITANDPKAIHHMVLNGAGITATARYIAIPEIERGNLVRVLPEWSVPAVDVSLVMPAGKERSAPARAFVDFMRQRAAGNSRWFEG